MATLENVNGASFVPDLSGPLNQLFGVAQGIQKQRAQQSEQQQLDDLLAQAMGIAPAPDRPAPPSGSVEGPGGFSGVVDGRRQVNSRRQDLALARMTQINPQMAKAVMEMRQRGDEREIAETNAAVEEKGRRAAFVLSQPLESRTRAIQQIAQQDLADGKNADSALALLNMSPQDQELSLRRDKINATDFATLAKPQEVSPPKTREIKQGDRVVTQQFNPQTNAFETIADAPRFDPKSGVTVINEAAKAQAAGLTKEQEEAGKNRVVRLNALQDQAAIAESQNEQIDQLANIDTQTGFGVQTRANIASIINGLGGDGESITGIDPANVQAFNAVAGKQVLAVMATQKGPQTDLDQARIAKTLQSIGNEPKANAFIKSSLKALNLRHIEQATFYEKTLEEKGTLASANKDWREFKKATPMVSDQAKNAETGLPMFFYEFKEKAKERNPTATDEQIVNAWREIAK